MLSAAATTATLSNLAVQLPPALWLDALGTPDVADMRLVLVHYAFLPRLAISLLCGAALGLAGTVLQQVLRNPLASPETVGVSAGAHLALALATLAAPSLLAFGREWVALAGAFVAMAAVVALSWHKRLSPLSVVLAGLVVSLYAGGSALPSSCCGMNGWPACSSGVPARSASRTGRRRSGCCRASVPAPSPSA
ncbi:hypothetical protein AJ88_15945 [Mesorhizobium amorphae CCBAU 01583]|nr:hypothetical protein AJ88_15945 [Mesorhizobium amorphae CCBAU 01583]